MNLDNTSVKLIELMLSDKQFLSLLVDDKSRELYRHVSIQSNGDVTFGKTSWPFINNLFNDKVTVSFETLVARMIRIIGGSNKSDDAKVLLRGLSEEFLDKCLKKDNKNELIEQIFTAYFYGYDGEHSSHFPKIGSTDCKETQKISRLDAAVAVELAGGRTILVNVKVFENGEEFLKQRRTR